MFIYIIMLVLLVLPAGLAFMEEEEMAQNSTKLTSSQIAAAVLFIETAGKSEEHAKKKAYEGVAGNVLSIRRCKVVLDHRWLTDDVSGTTILDLYT
jgi:hypothetical protein